MEGRKMKEIWPKHLDNKNAESKLQAKIRNILMKDCPAFNYQPSWGGAVWHKCGCYIYSGPKEFSKHDAEPSCICVWRLTDTCSQGTWPQLAFVKEEAAKIARKYSEVLMAEERERFLHSPEYLIPKVKETIKRAGKEKK